MLGSESIRSLLASSNINRKGIPYHPTLSLMQAVEGGVQLILRVMPMGTHHVHHLLLTAAARMWRSARKIMRVRC